MLQMSNSQPYKEKKQKQIKKYMFYVAKLKIMH